MAKGYRFTAARRAAFRKMLAARRNSGRRRYRRNTTKAQHRAARRAGAAMGRHLTKHQRRVAAGRKAARTRARNEAAKRARPKKSSKRRRSRRRTGVGRVRRAIRLATRTARRYKRRMRRRGKRYFRRKYLQRGRAMVRLNRRRRSRRARRNPSRRRRSIRARRRGYRRNPSRRRRSFRIWRRVKGGFYRKNPAQFLKQGAWTLGGLAASRALPLLVANFAPNAASSIVGAAGAWSGVVLSGLSLGALHFATKRFFTARRGEIMVGATLGLLWEVAMRVLPGGVLGVLGLAPASAPAAGGGVSGEYIYGVSEYVSDPGALSGAYVEEGVGVDVQEAMGSCPNCTGNADVRAALGPFHATKDIVSGGSGYAGILGGSIFAQ